MTVLLSRKAVVQAKVETVSGTPETLTVNDGVLCADPTFEIDPSVLERNFVQDSLSPQAHIIGRKIAKMTFQTELRGNSKQQSGILTDAPIISRLFRACGYEAVARTAPSAKGVFDVDVHANPVTWAVNTTAADNTDVIAYYIKVTLGGVSGTAKLTVTSDTAGEGSAEAIVTSGTNKQLGTRGLVVTPTFTGSLVLGQEWVVWLIPKGIELRPISDAFESVTLAMNKDGVKHLMPGAFGTFEITATAGEFATIDWTFTGLYRAPIDEAMPSAVYERTLPSQVELARLRLQSFSAVVEEFTFDQGNDIQIRPDVSSADGYIGIRIVSRNPEGGVNPEADRVANYDFWSTFANAKRMPFQLRVGKDIGNTVWIIAPGVQYTGLTYADRNGILTYDAGLKFPGYSKNDEVGFFFI